MSISQSILNLKANSKMKTTRKPSRVVQVSKIISNRFNSLEGRNSDPSIDLSKDITAGHNHFQAVADPFQPRQTAKEEMGSIGSV